MYIHTVDTLSHKDTDGQTVDTENHDQTDNQKER